MTSPVLLAVDAGTSRMKAALMDGTRRVLALEACDIPVQHPFEGASEVNMRLVWDIFCGLTQRLKNKNPALWPALAAACVSAQGDGCWPVDERGEPMRNALLWNDTRSRELALDQHETIDQYCVDHSITPMFPGAAPALMRWLKAKEPECYAKIHRVLHCKDWLNFQLTGEVVTDASDASTALTNVRNLAYDAGLLELLGIQESLGCYPTIQASGSLVGRVQKRAAQSTDLPEGLPIILGGIDVAVAAAGAAVTQSGDALTIVGTTLCNEIVLEDSQVDHRDTRGSTLRHVVPDRFLRVMATSSGTSSIDWARKTFAPGVSFPEIEASIAAIPPGSNGVLFHPYLYGERAPFRDPFACGGFYGLSAHHTPMDLMRAVYEGIGMMFVDCYQALPGVRQVVVTGGGASSDVLCQILADCLGKTVVRTGIEELGLHGAYTLMCQALEISMAQDRSADEPARLFSPALERVNFYRSLYLLYRDVTRSMQAYWHARNQLFYSTD